jgi:hypothetical protein
LVARRAKALQPVVSRKTISGLRRDWTAARRSSVKDGDVVLDLCQLRARPGLRIGGHNSQIGELANLDAPSTI